MINKDKNVIPIKGFPLIKIKSREIIEKTRAGSFYMNSLKVYREMYAKSNDNVIGDPYEGKLIVHNAVLQIEKLGTNQVIKDFAFPTANENDFVFCMFGVNSGKHHSFTFNEEQKQKLAGCGDTALLITDVSEYFKRIKKAADANNLEITSGFVDYYDENVDDIGRLLSLVTKGIRNIVFNKVKDYSYQNEYRFTTPNFIGDRIKELDIGNIEDISEVFTTKELLNSYMVSET